MRDLSDKEVGELQDWLDAAAATAGVHPGAGQGLDVSALDGLLCGVLLQPQRVAEADWLALVQAEARGGAAAGAPRPLPRWPSTLPLLRRRHAALDEAIGTRRWFDPWIFPPHDTAAPASGDADEAGDAAEADLLRNAVLPWVAGFALACEHFPGLMQRDAEALAQPLALLYLHFDAEDLEGLEDEPELAAALAATEPPADLAQAAEDLVRAVLLLADVSRPVRPAGPVRPASPRPARPGGAAAQTAPAHARPGRPPRSKSARRARARPAAGRRRCARPAAPGRLNRR
jgi:uncharacterized protein